MKKFIALLSMFMLIAFTMPVHAAFTANDYTVISINAPPGDFALIVCDNFAIPEQSYFIQPEPQKTMYAAARSSQIQWGSLYAFTIELSLHNCVIPETKRANYRNPRDGLNSKPGTYTGMI